MTRAMVGLWVLAAAGGLAAGTADDKELPVVLRDDFAKGSAAWEPTDPTAWKVIDAGPGKALSQFKQSTYKPPHRSPLNLALVKGVTVGDFVLEARVRSTAKPTDRRDVCVVFGHRDPAHFYYAHIAPKQDDHHHQVFIVNGADRRKITATANAGGKWDDQWHRIRVARTAGAVAVYVDDFTSPVLTATDATFPSGRVGVGTFDDSADWADVTLRGVKIGDGPAK
jgi:hypothetical protein